MIAMAVSVAFIIALSLLTGPWPPLLVAAALAWLAFVVATCVAGLAWQGREYGREQRIERAARLAELERWFEADRMVSGHSGDTSSQPPTAAR